MTAAESPYCWNCVPSKTFLTTETYVGRTRESSCLLALVNQAGSASRITFQAYSDVAFTIILHAQYSTVF